MLLKIARFLSATFSISSSLLNVHSVAKVIDFLSTGQRKVLFQRQEVRKIPTWFAFVAARQQLFTGLKPFISDEVHAAAGKKKMRKTGGNGYYYLVTRIGSVWGR
ncbi:hypothetical protein [Pontibacter liquoris]|uniref:hypothetical protein n=1 Tax=Pontibacter liquoris TaxID=2905677 RepID=UPI001FA7FDF3|nr:hypothetical protein [Pontibacter liquoris]